MTSAPVPVLQRESELRELLALYVREAPTTVLELGVAYGGTLFYWLRDARRDVPVTIVAVDTFAEYGRPSVEEWVPENVDLHLIAGRTSDPSTIESVFAIAPRFDWVFIDADHSYENARNDWLAYGTSARTVVFHDVTSDPRVHPEIEVGRLFDELSLDHRWLQIVAGERQPWGGFGVIWP